MEAIMRFPHLKTYWCVLLLACGSTLLLSQDETDAAADWQARWSDLEARDDLVVERRLEEQTALLLEAGQAVGWRDQGVWDGLRELLAGWETSPQVEVARAAYLGLLTAVGSGASSGEGPLPDEALLREAIGTTEGEVRSDFGRPNAPLRDSISIARSRRSLDSENVHDRYSDDREDRQ